MLNYHKSIAMLKPRFIFITHVYKVRLINKLRATQKMYLGIMKDNSVNQSQIQICIVVRENAIETISVLLL